MVEGRNERGTGEEKRKLFDFLKPESQSRIEEISQKYIDRMTRAAEEAEKEAEIPVSVLRGRLYK